MHYLNAQEWLEIENIDDDITDYDPIKMSAEFMIKPKKLYRIVFIGEQFQFRENSELQVNALKTIIFSKHCLLIIHP